jgi:hypothetical protein
MIRSVLVGLVACAATSGLANEQQMTAERRLPPGDADRRGDSPTCTTRE